MDADTGVAGPIPASILKRRARNRASQKTFRERQARYVKELETSLAELTRESSDELAAAKNEVYRLSQALTASKDRVLGLRDALTAVAEEIDQSLDRPFTPRAHNATSDATFPGANNAVEIDDEEPLVNTGDNCNDGANVASDSQPGSGLIITQDQTESLDIVSNQRPDSHCHALAVHEQTEHATDNAAFRSPTALGVNRHTTQTVPIQALRPGQFEYGTGDCLHWQNSSGSNEDSRSFPTLLPADSPEEHLDLPGCTLSFPSGVINFPSVFSAHLSVIDFFAKKNISYTQRMHVGGAEAFSKLLSTMVNMFVTTCWPDMCIWWTYIQSSVVVEKIMRWNLDSCLDTYKSLPVTHRPTALQMCTVHPPIIDWAFFPSIRDRMIELYSHSWMLDEIVCELVHAYVVEADLSSLVTGLENLAPQKGYFRMWDIVQTISSDKQRHSPGTQQSSMNWMNELGVDAELFSEPTDLFELEYTGVDIPWTKMPLERIYQSPKAAWKLFKLLRMEDRRAVKIDPVFAAAHPELCDDSSIVASGLNCTLRDSSTSVPRPKPLTREAIINYKMILGKS